MSLASCSDVRKSYGSTPALRGVTFHVDAGEIVALLGPNGAGKTTSVEILLGLREAEGGDVRVCGGRPSDPAVRARIGATPQQTGFPDALRVCEIVDFVAAHYPHPDVVRAMDTFGLAEYATRKLGDLSGGVQRRVALALAFVGRPELAVLDEPTTGLDVESRRRLWETIRATSGPQSALLFTTHYLEEAEQYATRTVVIDRGLVVFDGTPSVLRARFGTRRMEYVGAAFDFGAHGIEAQVERRDGVTVVVAADTDACVRALVRADIPFSDLRIVEPSLEDAFLSVTGSAV